MSDRPGCTASGLRILPRTATAYDPARLSDPVENAKAALRYAEASYAGYARRSLYVWEGRALVAGRPSVLHENLERLDRRAFHRLGYWADLGASIRHAFWAGYHGAQGR